MRAKRQRGPRWTMLHLIMLLGMGGLILAHDLHLSPAEHKLTLYLIVAAAYGLLGLWVRSNKRALYRQEAERYRQQRRDPTVYGTLEFPTRTQDHFRRTVSIHHHD
jgi:hypothetical protein